MVNFYSQNVCTEHCEACIKPNIQKNIFNPALDLMILKVFSFFDTTTLKVNSYVCKYWMQLVTELIKKPLIVRTEHPKPCSLLAFSIAIATVDNAEEIADLVTAAFSKGDIFRKAGQARVSKSEVVNEMRTPYKRWYVLLKNQIIATMLYSSDSPSDASIHMLSAHPDYWGQKLGTQLISKAEEVAKFQGKLRLNLSAANINVRLIKTYEMIGFNKAEDCKEDEYFPPDLQEEFLKPEYQGYEADGRAKLRNYNMTKILLSS